MPHPDQPKWVPGPFAIERDAAHDPEYREPASVAARHPTAPFVRHLDLRGDTPAALQGFALEYLRQVKPRVLGLLDEGRKAVFETWLTALDPRSSSHPDPRFGWLPLVSPAEGFSHPMVSYRFARRDETTLVLLASERVGVEPRSQEFLGSGFGLRVVGHLRKMEGPAPYLELRISGLTASFPFGSAGTYGTMGLDPGVLTRKLLGEKLAEKAEAIKTRLDLWRPVFTRMRLHGDLAKTIRFELHGSSFDYASEGSSASHRGRGTLPFAFYVKGAMAKDGRITELAMLERVPLVAYAARAFLQDPASQGAAKTARERRPTRGDSTLGEYLGDPPPLATAPFEVRTGRLVRPPRPNTEPKRPPASLVRSNDFGEIGARTNLGRFFARLERYGIDPKAYFRLGRLRVVAVTRSGIRPGPGKDGNTVNARVTLGPWGKDFYDDAIESDDRPEIHVHLALADLSTRSRARRTGDDPVAAESLGIAADPRWFWHEIGHVLLAAGVGELEFRFAHSPGDALAAIASDPCSQLVDGPARGATFPWVFIPRRHDRCAAHGWSWSGAMHRPARLRAFPDRMAFKGYWSEQILSSSLFRLYRVLGGDAVLVDSLGKHVPDSLAREAAADYVLYLVIKAIGLLGYAGAVPADRPDHFVSALIDADIGTETLSSTVPELRIGSTPTSTFVRVGGCAHKVIRWAFEAQGLYAPAGEFRNGAGEPPLVDIYIADGRRSEETSGYTTTRYGPGSYVPVPLGWTPPGEGNPPPWHAAPAAITVEPGGVFVTVGNRGSETATNVEVKLWARKCPGPGAPEWDPAPGVWAECATPAPAPQEVAPDKRGQPPTRFGPFEVPATVGRPCVVLAVATCTDDRANTDAVTLLPCSRRPVPLADLVASDNNLGLRYLPQ
jgi:hypothetical protein